MSYLPVTRTAGPAREDGKGAFSQPQANEHAAYMDTLADQGLLVFAGPLAGTEHDRIRVVLIADADSELAIRARLTDDPGSAHAGSRRPASSRGTSSPAHSGWPPRAAAPPRRARAVRRGSPASWEPGGHS